MKKYEIACYPWGGDYRPKTEAEVDLLEGKGILVRMSCEEENPRAVYQEENEPVYQDSCMEFFLNAMPEKSELYLNFEVNANGALLCYQGKNRTERRSLKELSIERPQVEVKRDRLHWEIQYLISFELLSAVYGECRLHKSSVIRGNFYKCGDLTEKPHYGCWNPIVKEKPDFHVPEFFGEISFT